MENNEIMGRLLQDDKQQTSNKIGENPATNSNRDNEVPMSRIRVVTAKYKVYIILLAIFIFLLVLVYIPNLNNSLTSKRSAHEQVKTQLDNLKKDIKNAQDNMDYLCNDWAGIISNENILIRCLSNESVCAKLPDSWKTWTWNSIEDYETQVPLSYLQLHSLYSKKMLVDEKNILKNLNEYLIKQDISWNDRNKVWDILRINIWDPEVLWASKENDSNFFRVNVDVEIKFQTVQDLLEFLYNVEKKIVNDKDDRVLYKIQSVSYDVVSMDEPQVTNISMTAYYYHDERFIDKVECENYSESGNDKQFEENVENSEESGSIFDKIFNSLKIW